MTDVINGILGIDISKAKFDVALLVAGKVKKTHVFDNTPDGFMILSNWLLKQGNGVHGSDGLLHIIYGVLKSGVPFDPAWSANHA